MEPAAPPRRTLLALVALQLATLAIAGLALVRAWRTAPHDEETAVTLEDLADLQDQVDELKSALDSKLTRMQRTVDRLEQDQGDTVARGQTPTDSAMPPQLDASSPIVTIIDRMAELTEMAERYASDPIQREPVTKELRRLEQLLRSKGEAAIADLATRLPTLKDSKLQSKLLVNVVEPIETPAAQQIAWDVFHDKTFLAGVRLVGARVAMKSRKDEVIGELVRLLEGKDDSFDRRDDIAQFFKATPDPRAVKPLCQIAKNTEESRLLRRFALQALGSFHEPEVIDVLKDVTAQEAHGELRAEALHSLNDSLGRAVMDFLEFLKPKLNADDPLLKLVIGYEEYWNKQPQ